MQLTSWKEKDLVIPILHRILQGSIFALSMLLQQQQFLKIYVFHFGAFRQLLILGTIWSSFRGVSILLIVV